MRSNKYLNGSSQKIRKAKLLMYDLRTKDQEFKDLGYCVRDMVREITNIMSNN